jgi:hypothetical protein
MSFKMPRADEIAKVVQESLQTYLEWHICETYGVLRVEDLSFTEAQELMAEYFNQKSMDLNSMLAVVLRNIIRSWELANGKGIL